MEQKTRTRAKEPVFLNVESIVDENKQNHSAR